MTTESETRKSASDECCSRLHIAFGKYAGQTFKWLLENNICRVVWLLHEYAMRGENNPLLKWQKEQLKAYVLCFATVSVHLKRTIILKLSFISHYLFSIYRPLHDFHN